MNTHPQCKYLTFRLKLLVCLFVYPSVYVYMYCIVRVVSVFRLYNALPENKHFVFEYRLCAYTFCIVVYFVLDLFVLLLYIAPPETKHIVFEYRLCALSHYQKINTLFEYWLCVPTFCSFCCSVYFVSLSFSLVVGDS